MNTSRLRSIGASLFIPLVTGLIAVSPVAAQANPPISLADCNALNGTPVVGYNVQTSGGSGVLMEGPVGTFSGQVTLELFCSVGGAKYSEIKDSAIGYVTFLPNTTVTYTDTSGAHVTKNAFCKNTSPDPSNYIPDPSCVIPQIPSGSTGQVTITVTTTNPNMPPGQYYTSALDKVSSPIGKNYSIGTLVAQTPELGSLALFGSGALATLGYFLTKRRARQGSGE